MRREAVLAGRIYGERVVPYVMDDFSSIDIDTPLDLAWAEFLLERKGIP
jgi:CMP-N-acetylneuraminic acid synthetase